MTERGQAGGENLTGVWHGLYTYPRDLGSVAFVATLIESGSSLSGATHDPCSIGGPEIMRYATLAGTRQASAVSFVKTYDGPAEDYSRAVHYEGTLSADRTEIEGRWTIAGVWSGPFLMIRSAGKAAKVSRKVVQRA